MKLHKIGGLYFRERYKGKEVEMVCYFGSGEWAFELRMGGRNLTSALHYFPVQGRFPTDEEASHAFLQYIVEHWEELKSFFEE